MNDDFKEELKDCYARIEQLEARLEVSPDHPYDGIHCRDETIRLLDSRIQQLEAQLTAMQWRAIETAPKDGTPLLLLWPDAAEKMAVMWWDEYHENWLGYYDGINPGYQPPTHWMPLPPPPSGETDE